MRIIILIFLFVLFTPVVNAAHSSSTGIFPHYSLNYKNMATKKNNRYFPLLEDQSTQSSQDKIAQEKFEKKLENDTLTMQENELRKRQRGDRGPSYNNLNPMMLHFSSN